MDYSLKTLSDIGKTNKKDQRRNKPYDSDLKSNIINDVRNIFTNNSVSQMKQEEIYKRLKKLDPMSKLTRDNVDQVLMEYKNLQVLYIDDDENVVFL